ncbi:basic amino acid ABC transporter substrate-binding protein [Thermoflavimicrobium daqui]|uniref:Basic amino acid ABC transporter substrate-binding protein n=1 Tax=Thermoflavimicrobium daqui TaxID=2137476 RepID=A0A364K707_9BACL|nr:basic amino acid ABC transporter substrate-binding protein [Thermoflavimicrobium daqui]RAL26085.1 basic amino acid ABC transporter substrate-binding protein [Thermoflavimicrobium daqui]
MKKAWNFPFIFLIASIFFLTSCNMKIGFGGKESSANGKRLLIATDAQFPPFTTLGTNGVISGFDVDIFNAIIKEVGMDADFKHVGWDPIFTEVLQGKADASICSITITPERQKKYDFTNPYFTTKQLILVPIESNARSLSYLRGSKIGTLVSSTGSEAVKKEFGENYSKLKEFDDIPSAIKELEAGRLNAVVTDSAVVQYYIKTLQKAEIKKQETLTNKNEKAIFVVQIGSTKIKAIEDPFFPAESYGIMVKKGNKELLNKLNEGLAKIKSNGTYDQIYKKYFGDQ